MPALLQSALQSVFNSPLMLFILGLIVLIMGLLMTLVYGSMYQADLKSRTWPSVPGRILSDRVEKRRSHSRNGDSTFYMPKIQYSYQVAGADHTGEKIANAIFYSQTRKGLDRLKKRYPAGIEVKVFYDPQNPTQSVLQPKTWSNLPSLLFGMAFDAFGLVLLGLWLYRLIFH